MVLHLLGSNPALSFCGLLASIQQLLPGLEKTAVTFCRQMLSSALEDALEVFMHNC